MSNYINFHITPGSLVTNKGSSYRSYNISINLKGYNNNKDTIDFSLRFNNIKHADKFLIPYLQGRYPSKHIFSDYTKNEENVKERAKEIEKYFNFIFKQESVLSNIKYHKHIGMNSDNIDKLSHYISTTMKDIENEDKIKESQLHVEQFKQIQEFILSLSQSLNNNIPILTLSNNITFILQERAGWGDDIIYGPDKKPWFKLKRIDLYQFLDQYALTTLSGQPLMILDQKLALLNTYDLIRIGGQSQQPQLLCSMNKFEILFNLTFGIEKKSNLCPNIKITGDIKTCTNKFYEDDKGIVAYLEKKSVFESHTYSVSIKKHEDIILYLSLAILMDKMAHGKTDVLVRNRYNKDC